MRDSRPQPRRLAAGAAALAAALAGATPASAQQAAAATVAVQAVEPTGDGRARVTACSGTLIAPDIVLTAGHCLDGASDPSRVAVFVYRDGRPIPEPLVAARFARHPGHVQGWAAAASDPETRQREIAADLALIRLGCPVAGATPLALIPANPASGAITGVGAADAGGRSGAMKTGRLSNVRVSTGSGAKVAFATASRTICRGDSGGPATGPDGSGLWGVVAAVLRAKDGCGTRLAVTLVDPSSEGFARMRAALGSP